MDEEMEDLNDDFLEPAEIDWDYEFDAPQFFDFIHSEIGDTERWFQIAGNYPPSPLIAKLNLHKAALINSNTSPSLSDGRANSTCSTALTSAASDVSDVKECYKGSEVKGEMKSDPRSSKSRTSTLMKPTASHLAKLSKSTDAHSSCLCGRLRDAAIHKIGKSFLNSPGVENGGSKRQKLEKGYQRKVAHLKHQNLLLHKLCKKVTIAKEPELETLQRAHIWRLRKNSDSCSHAEPKTRALKARPLNSKILQAPSSVTPKKGRPKEPEFQVSHLKSMERALQHSSANDCSTYNAASALKSGVADQRRTIYLNTLKEKCYTPKIKMRSLNSKIFPTKDDICGVQDIRHGVTIPKESKLPNDEKLSHHPPTELFAKLTLRSELENDKVSSRKSYAFTKVPKENAPHSLQRGPSKGSGKPNKCGRSGMIPGLASRSYMNRSLDIR